MDTAFQIQMSVTGFFVIVGAGIGLAFGPGGAMAGMFAGGVFGLWVGGIIGLILSVFVIAGENGIGAAILYVVFCIVLFFGVVWGGGALIEGIMNIEPDPEEIERSPYYDTGFPSISI